MLTAYLDNWSYGWNVAIGLINDPDDFFYCSFIQRWVLKSDHQTMWNQFRHKNRSDFDCR